MELNPLVVRRADPKSSKRRQGFRPVRTKSIETSSTKKRTRTIPPEDGEASSTIVDPASRNNTIDDVSQLDPSQSDDTAGLNPTESTEQTSVETRPTKVGTRKRKQTTSITIGATTNHSSSGATTRNQTVPPTNKQQRTTRSSTKATVVAPGLDALQRSTTTTVEDESLSPPRTSTRRLTSLVTTNTTQGPIGSTPVPPQDQHLLQRLASENPNGVRLSTFCSVFKGQKQPRAKKGTGTNGRGNTSTKNNKSSKNTNAHSLGNKAKSNDTTPDVTGAPVVKIVDGEIVLQESSLMVPGQRRTVQEVEEEFQDVVEEDAQLAIVGASYNSFVNRKGPQHWTVEETKRFFEALRQMGTDFCAMEAFFENRNRKQLKRKYRSELIRNAALVEMALDPKNRTAIDLSIFDVEVDPKAIEEAAKDIPPPYIPTEANETDGPTEGDDNTTSPSEDAVAIAAAIAANTSAEVVVEEDEDEEAVDDFNRQRASVRFADDDPSLWPEMYDDRGAGVDEGDVDEFGMPEPSMDDFFEEQGQMVEAPLQQDETDVQIQTAPTPQPTVEGISLVPLKGSTKTKKPKFRTASRKKK